MSTRSFTSLVVVATALTVACEGGSTQTVEPSPIEMTGGAVGVVTTAAAAQHAVTLFDACDPDTFNATLGPGTCVRSGGVRFDKFIEELTRHHSVGAWHFAPSEVTMKVGEQLVAQNRGGEDHTFTEVEEFGGGNVALLNDLAGLTTVAPECAGAVRIHPGASTSETEDEEGVEKYQCCIHPWMRAEVRVKEK
jgi:plastocyanin